MLCILIVEGMSVVVNVMLSVDHHRPHPAAGHHHPHLVVVHHHWRNTLKIH